MKLTLSTTIFLALAAEQAIAFSPLSSARFNSIHRIQHPTASSSSSSQLFIGKPTPEEQTAEDNEIERLKAMAQKLRAEAAALEAHRAKEIAAAAESVFKKFDTDNDGAISFQELKAGLEKTLKMELPESRVMKLMDDFDVSRDGKLQLEEFAGVEMFRNRLEQLIQEEKKQAREAVTLAQKEADMAKLAEARMQLLNDKEPTMSDKIVSIIPYLLPLLDGLQFGRFLIVENQDNPLVIALAVLFSLFKSIPFGGFVAFLTLQVLSGNPSINRLVRFNMQQAIFLDIALFFPSLLGAVFALTGAQVPQALSVLGSDVVFGTLFLTIAYASISSLIGITPNKIPLISQSVEDRMPSLDMFDDQGLFNPRKMREEKENDDEKDN